MLIESGGYACLFVELPYNAGYVESVAPSQ